jgi:hypothetical protein
MKREELQDLAERLEALPAADQLVVASELVRKGSPSNLRLARTIIDRVSGLLAMVLLQKARP